jgi:hypothetical protein
MSDIQIWRYIEVKKYFWSPGTINYFVGYISFLSKVKFQWQVSENKVTIFSSSKFAEPLKSLRGNSEALGWFREPQVKNSCFSVSEVSKRDTKCYFVSLLDIL